MIAEIITQLEVKSLPRLVDYLTNSQDRSVIGPFQDDNRTVVNAFQADTARHRIKTPLWHIFFSAAPNDPELDDATWVEIVDTYPDNLGYGNCLTWSARHRYELHPRQVRAQLIAPLMTVLHLGLLFVDFVAKHLWRHLLIGLRQMDLNQTRTLARLLFGRQQLFPTDALHVLQFQ